MSQITPRAAAHTLMRYLTVAQRTKLDTDLEKCIMVLCRDALNHDALFADDKTEALSTLGKLWDEYEGLEDWFDEVIGDSLDMDWTSRVAARAIMRRLIPTHTHLEQKA